MKICIVTGARSEWGLLRPLVERLKSDPYFKVSICATGSHLSPYHGQTIKEIDETVRVEMLLASDTNLGMCKSLGLAVMGLADSFSWLKPDLVLLLGDRYETFAAAQAAFGLGIRIAHLHGGEQTGCVDDAYRDCITRMADIHFVATQRAGRRISEMYSMGKLIDGHNDWVYVVGSLGCQGLEPVKKKQYPDTLLVVVHPVTPIPEDMGPLMAVLLQRTEKKVFILPNADAGADAIWQAIIQFCCAGHGSYVTHLERKDFLSLLANVKAIVGNSSAGIIEAPALGTPTVNIGCRQRGRECADTIINCINGQDAIFGALDNLKYLDDIWFTYKPYGGGDVIGKIIERLKK